MRLFAKRVLHGFTHAFAGEGGAGAGIQTKDRQVIAVVYATGGIDDQTAQRVVDAHRLQAGVVRTGPDFQLSAAALTQSISQSTYLVAESIYRPYTAG